VTRYAFVDREKAHHGVATLCRLLKVSRSGYYAWAEGRAPSARVVADNVLPSRSARPTRAHAAPTARRGCMPSSPTPACGPAASASPG